MPLGEDAMGSEIVCMQMTDNTLCTMHASARKGQFWVDEPGEWERNWEESDVVKW
jgi:hypothetical protein